MSRLSLSLLGPLEVMRDGEPVTAFESVKVRALLAYLAVEADHSHARASLAGLLWPDWPDRSALANLRYALTNLRQAIGDRDAETPCLLISRETVQFNRHSDHALDVARLAALLSAARARDDDAERLGQAIALYRGPFLEGFALNDSAPFEAWLTTQREALQREFLGALRHLAALCERQGDYPRAEECARRHVALEPSDERGQQQLLRALALGGQRSAALAQYEACRRTLAEELGVEPARETTILYERILGGAFPEGARAQPSLAARAMELPAFLRAEQPPDQAPRPRLLARERELASLRRQLDLALAGQGRVAFITGDPGSGKTALAHEFTRRALAAYPDLIVAGGNGNAYTGLGDPYLPFIEVLQLLTGDVDDRLAVGALSRDEALRLWTQLPDVIEALLEKGESVLDLFLNRSALLTRARLAAPPGTTWLTRLEERLARPLMPYGPDTLPSSALSKEYTQVLLALSRRRPLLLLLDDLQWADASSLNLLFHLGRSLAGSRILMLGAYRPADVSAGRGGERHPLEALTREFRRIWGDGEVNLAEADGRQLVDELLDGEPHALPDSFREALYRQTGGQALFTVEFWRGLQARGDVTRDAAGRWIAAPSLDWERLPAQMEAVIAEHIGRLPAGARELLTIGSVEGEEFTAEVAARVLGRDERDAIASLSGELSKQHNLVRAQSVTRIGERRLSRYRFRHYLFQHYLDQQLDAVQRAELHEAVGRELAALYGDRAAEIAVQLARHAEEAGLAEQAREHLGRAAVRAWRVRSVLEAIVHTQRSLTLLATLPESHERDEEEYLWRYALLQFTFCFGALESSLLDRLRALHRRLGKQGDHAVEFMEVVACSWRGDIAQGLMVGERFLAEAEQQHDLAWIAGGRHVVGFERMGQGAFAAALAHFEWIINTTGADQRSFIYGEWSNGGQILSYSAWCLWFLGHVDQALRRQEEARRLGPDLDVVMEGGTHEVDTLQMGLRFHLYRREAQPAREYLSALVAKRPFGWPPGSVSLCTGMLRVLEGRPDEGAALLRQGLAEQEAVGNVEWRTIYLTWLAEGCGAAGQPTEGLAAIAEAQALMERTGERMVEAEINRIRGELLLAQRADLEEVEDCYRQAIAVAQQQQAKSWELRATLSLARLLRDQGRAVEARDALAAVYGWFTEGFDTADLVDAKALLDELAQEIGGRALRAAS